MTTKNTSQDGLDTIKALTASLVHHTEYEHPDPDMTEPCKFKDDIDTELQRLLLQERLRAFNDVLSIPLPIASRNYTKEADEVWRGLRHEVEKRIATLTAQLSKNEMGEK